MFNVLQHERAIKSRISDYHPQLLYDQVTEKSATLEALSSAVAISRDLGGLGGIDRRCKKQSFRKK